MGSPHCTTYSLNLLLGDEIKGSKLRSVRDRTTAPSLAEMSVAASVAARSLATGWRETIAQMAQELGNIYLRRPQR